MVKLYRIVFAMALLAQGLEAHSAGTPQVSHVPVSLDKSCRNGRAQRYDECSHQIDVLLRAMKQARRENKVVLVVYGAEWCIWCHVFSKFVDGEVGEFTYTYGTSDEPDAGYTTTMAEDNPEGAAVEAEALKSFVAKYFVVTHIEGLYAPGGDAVLTSTGADRMAGDSIPFVYTIDRSGHYSAQLDHDAVEISTGWLMFAYRGYDRMRLKAELGRMHDAALTR